MTFILLILTSILIAANAQNPSSPRFVTRGESLDNIRKSEMKQYIERVDEWKAQREAYQRQAKALRDRYYDEYFEKMKDYARVVEQQRYTQLLQKQAEERAKLEQSMRYWGVGNVPNSNSEPSSPRPVDPFGSRSSPPSSTNSGSQNLETISNDSKGLQNLCQRYMPTVRLHCNGQIEEKYRKRCEGYYRDCQQYVYRGDPLYSIAHSFSSGVGLNLGSWAVKGIPYYPINEEGAIGAGRLMNIPFGSWGGGYSDHIGVRDYWSQYTEIGANWYDGKYGYKSGWSVPLVQSLGIEGDTHALVSVPIRQGELGKPVGVDVGGGVGPYYQQNTHVGVDYLNGRVGTGFGVGVPLAGVGVGTGLGIKFPGASDIWG